MRQHLCLIRPASVATTQRFASISRNAGPTFAVRHKSSAPAPKETTAQDKFTGFEKPEPEKKKTVLQLDEELRKKLEDMSGEGGAAGVEYENGVAEGLKHDVKANMFRIMPTPAKGR